ncbi:DUF5630 domain-containing protein [Legionella clemsonensis]|uniref:Uncharacterized protein n=1 Tax=Legionella clemsonensis TaxID=1867846 RepID=A0A222P3Q8_9GAMM|nr:DUF5630 domain-containing protein [Legionella clemsonensis]ASQ46473.1 hypothetical protein clem_09615 [Legionella clemsonensis]
MFNQFHESLNDFLKIQGVNIIVRDKFLGAPDAEKENIIRLMLDQCNFDLIVKFACTTPEFHKVCLSPIFDQDWIKLWSTYGIIISKDPAKAFYDQRCSNKFGLFLGVYFYYRAVRIKEHLAESNSKSEQNYLLKAMHYDSVHACQQFAHYLFEKCQNDTPSKAIEDAFKKQLFPCIKKLIPNYGSYAYLMLAEAYLQYGIILQKQDQKLLANKAFHAAQEAAIQAKNSYVETDTAIFNASFGRGMAASNSLHLDNFENISTYISTMSQTLFYPEKCDFKH